MKNSAGWNYSVLICNGGILQMFVLLFQVRRSVTFQKWWRGLYLNIGERETFEEQGKNNVSQLQV